MTYEEVKNQTLKLLNQYSVAGAEVLDTYNNQSDYIKRIPDLVNDAMIEIATSVRYIPETVLLSDLPSTEVGDKIQYVLPQDLYVFKPGDFIKTDDGLVLHSNDYMLLGKNKLLVNADDEAEYRVYYYRYPHLVDPVDPDLTEELDNDVDTHRAIPYYAAGMIVSHDDTFLCSLFMNQYADKLSLLRAPTTTEVHPVVDTYPFYGFNY